MAATVGPGKLRKSCQTSATARLKQDYIRIKSDPVPYISAEPLHSNILEWYVYKSPCISHKHIVKLVVYKRKYVSVTAKLPFSIVQFGV